MNASIEPIETPAPAALPGWTTVPSITPPYPLADRETRGRNTVVRVGAVEIGGPGFVVMAGPCAVENGEQLMATARLVRDGGGEILRGGAFKPRSSPYSFQGLEVDGLRMLKTAGQATGLPVVTEVMDSSDIPVVAEHADILQVGARNVQNFALLKKLGKISKPVLLKRGLMTTCEEFLLCAEYILSSGNDRVILCERGIRTFETATRSTLDLSAVPVLKEKTHLPVIVDPSHAAGHRRYVQSLARAALAVGADGILVEVHICPERALCDGEQALDPQGFFQLMKDLRRLALALGRTV